jgi:hypothetical protein
MKDRAQSTVIGAVLIFGILTVAFSTYHATFVPSEFKQTEFEHNEEVQGDMLELSDQIRDTSTTGIDSSQTVSFGGQYQVWTAYPSPPLYGGVETPNGTVTISGLTIYENAESNDYWGDGDQTYSTHSIRYSPTYREYRNPPDTVIEHGNVFNDFGDETLDVSSQDIVSDDSVNLILIGGDMNETRSGSGRIAVNSVSSSDSYTQVDGSFTLTIPTDRPESWWSDELSEPIVDSYTYGSGEVEITFSSSSPISLRISRISIDNEASPSAEYITIEDSVVTVNDEYGNPVGGVEVTVDETSSTYYSNQDGTVDIPDPSSTIHPYIDDNSSDQEFVTVESGDLSVGGPGSRSDPVIDSASNAGANGNKDRIDYTVSDADGDLSSIEFELRESDGTTLDTESDTSISGSSASGTSPDLNYGGNENPDNVLVTVTDNTGGESTTVVDI